ncbi:MAG TPA: hypothetical protein PK528_15335, partial [Syntrophorhabdus sp.]|nr:hypothetical protein [Syntrophorhabdus sp.]
MERKFSIINFLLPLGLLLICLLSYGLIAGKLGFFLDDWYIIWTYRTFGAAKFVEFFEGDRPLFSMVYRIFIPIIKDNPLVWQYFAIFTKWLSAIALWQLLRLIMPEKRWLTFSVAALFAVYPGFKFHYFSVMYGQNYAILTIYFLSYIFMILGIRKSKYRFLFIGLGLVFQFIGIAPMELYYGLELVRPVILFFMLPGEVTNIKSKLWKTFTIWLPYLLLFLGFTLFRVIFSHLYSYQVSFFDQLIQNPLYVIKDLIYRVLLGLFDSCVYVWVELLYFFTRIRGFYQIAFLLLLIFGSFLVAWFFIGKADPSKTDPNHKKHALILLGVGVFSVLAGMIPVIIGGLKVSLAFHTTRFLLPLSIGASLATVALIDMVFQNTKAKTVIVALLVALSVGANYTNGLEYKKAWDDQKEFFAQMTWRAPQIEPGTMLISPVLPFDLYFSGTSLTAPLNMIYAPDLRDNPIPYQMILAATPQMNTMPELLPNQDINRSSRVFTFIGNTSDAIAVYSPEKGCIKLLSPDIDPRAFQDDQYAELWSSIIPLSDLNRIDTTASSAEMP